MPKISEGYTRNFERAIERAILGLCPASAIRRIKQLCEELRKHPALCRDFLEIKVHELRAESLENKKCPECNSKLEWKRDRSKDEYCFYLGELEIKKFGGNYHCPKCKKKFSTKD